MTKKMTSEEEKVAATSIVFSILSIVRGVLEDPAFSKEMREKVLEAAHAEICAQAAKSHAGAALELTKEQVESVEEAMGTPIVSDGTPIMAAPHPTETKAPKLKEDKAALKIEVILKKLSVKWHTQTASRLVAAFLAYKGEDTTLINIGLLMKELSPKERLERVRTIIKTK